MNQISGPHNLSLKQALDQLIRISDPFQNCDTIQMVNGFQELL